MRPRPQNIVLFFYYSGICYSQSNAATPTEHCFFFTTVPSATASPMRPRPQNIVFFLLQCHLLQPVQCGHAHRMFFFLLQCHLLQPVQCGHAHRTLFSGSTPRSSNGKIRLCFVCLHEHISGAENHQTGCQTLVWWLLSHGGRVFLSGSPPFCFLAGHHWPLLLCCLFLCSQIAITAFFIAHTFPALLLMAATKCPWIFKIPVLFRPPLPPIPFSCGWKLSFSVHSLCWSAVDPYVSMHDHSIPVWRPPLLIDGRISIFDPGELLAVTVSQVLNGRILFQHPVAPCCQQNQCGSLHTFYQHSA